MDSEVYKSLLSIHNKVDGISGEIKDINASLNGLDCRVNNKAIQNLEKVVYGAVKVVLVAFILSVIGLVMYKGNTKAVAEQDNVKKVVKPAPVNIR